MGFNIRWFCSNDSVSGLHYIFRIQVYFKTYALLLLYTALIYSTTVLQILRISSQNKREKTAFELSPYFCFSSLKRKRRRHDLVLGAGRSSPLRSWAGEQFKAPEEVALCITIFCLFYKR